MANEDHLARLQPGVADVLAKTRQTLASGAADVAVWGKTWRAERQVREGIHHTRQ
jgi:hypothetical protein